MNFKQRIEASRRKPRMFNSLTATGIPYWFVYWQSPTGRMLSATHFVSAQECWSRMSNVLRYDDEWLTHAKKYGILPRH